MTPILFSADAQDFTSNGIGRLNDVISCSVTEERNGIYELEMVYCAEGEHYDEIDLGSIIVAKPFENGGRQAFRIYEISKPLNKRVTIYANHISYDMSYIPVEPCQATGLSNAVSAILGAVSTGVDNPFTIINHITDETETGYNQVLPKSLRACLGGSDGSILDAFSGSGSLEYLWDNFDVHIYRHRGSDKGFELRYGKNITGFTMEDNRSDLYTGVLPYWSNINADDTNKVVITGAIQYSQYVSNYEMARIIVLDMSEYFDTQPSTDDMNTLANTLVNASGVGLPSYNIDVNFVALWQTENYKGVAPLEYVNLCDTVQVYIDELGVSYSAKVIKTVYDVLRERYTSIEVGDTKSSLSKTLAANFNSIESIVALQNKVVSYVELIDTEGGTFSRTLAEQVTALDGTVTAQSTTIAQNTSSISAVVSDLGDLSDELDDLETRVTLTVEGLKLTQGSDGNYVLVTASGMEIYVDATKVAWATSEGFKATAFMTGDWVIAPYGDNILNIYKN